MRWLVSCCVVSLLVAVAVVDQVPDAHAQVTGADPLTIHVSVTGVASGGFSIFYACLPGTSLPPATPNWALKFNFDAAGHPTTAYAPQTSPAIVGDAWVVAVGPGPGPVTCRFAEVADSAPTALSWTCSSAVSPEPPPVNPDPSAPSRFGCLSASGSDTDPLLFTLYDAPGNTPPQVYTQTVDVTFANTFIPQPVILPPAFTG